MSAEIAPFPAPEPDRLNDLVVSNVMAELGRRRLSVRRAAALLGMSQQALSDRVNGRTRLTLDDTQRFAQLFGMTEPAELLARRAPGSASAAGSAAISEGGVKLPRLDSNQQPFD